MEATTITHRQPQLVVALDVPSASDIGPILNQLPPEIAWYKIGLELFVAEGPSALGTLAHAGKKVFLDLKLHDIPRTVARAVDCICRHGVSMITLHASGGSEMLAAAAKAAAQHGPNRPLLVAVTTLTSLNQDNLREMGITRPLLDHTLSLGELAIHAGIDGLVCSTLEAEAFRKRIGPTPVLVTPGIRPCGSDVGDQKRVATPLAATKAGSDFLVVGRPILEATNPTSAAKEILRQMAR